MKTPGFSAEVSVHKGSEHIGRQVADMWAEARGQTIAPQYQLPNAVFRHQVCRILFCFNGHCYVECS